MSFNTQIKEIILEVGRPHYPPSLPAMLVNFMDRCLEVDPRHRASAEELLKVGVQLHIKFYTTIAKTVLRRISVASPAEEVFLMTHI